MKSTKGAKWEREVCQLLSVWFSEGDVTADWFWRTAGSGGRSTNRKKKGLSAEKHCGDVCAIDPQGEPLLKVFAMELKKGYAKFTIQDLLDAPEYAAAQEYERWIEQAEESRDNSGALFWIIICKRDKRDPLVMMPSYVKACLLNIGHSWKGSEIKMELDSVDYGGILIAKFYDFLDRVTPDAIRALLKEKEMISGEARTHRGSTI